MSTTRAKRKWAGGRTCPEGCTCGRHRGWKWSDESRAKLSETVAAQFANGRKTPWKWSDTEPERTVEAMLVAMGKEFEKQAHRAGTIVDFVVNGTVVEVYGCYWHRCPECGFDDPHDKRGKDVKRMEKLGGGVVIWSHELEDLEAVTAKIFPADRPSRSSRHRQL